MPTIKASKPHKLQSKLSNRRLKYTGSMYYPAGVIGEDCKITEAIISQNRISIDWPEEGNRGHLEASSTDGINFRGNYGYPVPSKDLVFELKRYDANKEILFFGTWHERDVGDQGIWIIVLEEA